MIDPDSIDDEIQVENLNIFNIILKRTIHEAKKIFYDALFTKFKNDIRGMWKTINDILGAIQKCQHFHECTNSTLFQTPSPRNVQTNILSFQNMGINQNIYCATTNINPYFKPV